MRNKLLTKINKVLKSLIYGGREGPSRKKYSNREKNFQIEKKIFKSRKKNSNREKNIQIEVKKFKSRKKYSNREKNIQIEKNKFKSRKEYSDKGTTWGILQKLITLILRD